MEKDELSGGRIKPYRTFKSRGGMTFLEGRCGDVTAITPYNRVLFNKPGLIIGHGDIPDELKIKDGKPFTIVRASLNDVHTQHHPRLFIQNFNNAKEVIRSMEEDKYGLDDEEQQQQQQQQQEHKGDGQFKDDPTITMIVTEKEGSSSSSSNPRPLLSIENEDMISSEDVWVTFISRGGHRFLGRYVGGFLLVSQYEGIIINKPGLVVAAVGGIPDELKIEGEISFWFPAPIYKFPRLPKRFNVHHKIDYEVSEEGMGKELCSKALMRAYSKAMGVRSSICKDEESEDEEAYTDELFPTMILVNLATPQDIRHLDPSISPIISPSIPIKKEMEEDVGAKRISEDGKEASIHKRARIGSTSICKEEED